ncbi:D-alanyl-D-alanine carboxypeptidase family protein [Paenibacillus algorifonticola]|uniref:D-alanyl-D-alanine carboxypeptidase family protein n=1 Tax=Paenibacillus algorifonticola TaxID=684063 RepID=UPI001E319FCE|nr:D-alanyl-D-alanine carboxypeptidase family protein [Paenibacillus algorifonticola]
MNQENPVRQLEPNLGALSSRIRQASHVEEQRITLEKICIQQLSALLEACQAEDDIAAVSGYRSREAQARIFAASLEENGAAFTARYVAIPGASEHQTGLAVDVGLYRGDIDYIRPSFPDDGASGRFKALAAEYGFIQRYQESKEGKTGIACEPWHYRYVGYPHSMLMKQQDLCLEEYTAYIKQFAFNNKHLYVEGRSAFAQIYYVKAEEHITTVPIVSGDRYQLSGNNQDGFVVTVFHRKGDGSCE